MADVATTIGVTRRLTPNETRSNKRVAMRETSLGEQVLFCKLIRDGILQHFNPWKLSDLQCVLEMRSYKGLLSDTDLKEVYVEGMWGFHNEKDFGQVEWWEPPCHCWRK